MRDPGGKREQIKAEAMRLFVAHGLDAVSVRDIAAACAMKPSNLYAHFASREALVTELFLTGYAAYGDVLADAFGGGGIFRARLDAAIHALCALHDQDTIRFRFLVMSQHGFLRHIGPDARNPVEIICHAVADAMTDQEIPAREPELMAMAVIGLLVQPATGILYGRLAHGMAERADTIAAMCWRVLT